jgi:precorrin-2 dehydrogenase/sirohydrochlorin ferrochelatase
VATKHYPVMLDLNGKPALVVGAGPVASRKAETLAEYGARVTMVAPAVCAEARALADAGRVAILERPFEDADLDNPVLVFAATNDRALHEHIKAGCDARRILCNIVDVPDLCGFIVPSIIRRGELMITISTDGVCPSYSKFQRKRMERCCFPEGSEAMLHVIAAARNELKAGLGRGLDDEQKFELLRELAEGDLHEVLAREGEQAACAEAVRRLRERMGAAT